RQLSKTALAFHEATLDSASLDQAVEKLVELRRAYRERETAELFAPPTLAAFAAENAEPAEWVVYGYAARGTTAGIGGVAKVGKTTLLAEMLGAVASGADFLGHATLSGRALWIDL